MKFQLDRTKNEKLTYISPIVKIAHFGNVMSIDMTLPKWAIVTIEVYEEIPWRLLDPVEYIKNADTYIESFG